MSDTSGDGANGGDGTNGSGTQGKSGISSLFLNLQYNENTPDSVLNSIIVRHLTTSELCGTPIGLRPPSPVTSPQIDKEIEPNKMQHQTSPSTRVINSVSPIISCCYKSPNVSPKKAITLPAPESPIKILSSPSDNEKLNLKLEGVSSKYNNSKQETARNSNLEVRPLESGLGDKKNLITEEEIHYLEKLLLVVPEKMDIRMIQRVTLQNAFQFVEELRCERNKFDVTMGVPSLKNDKKDEELQQECKKLDETMIAILRKAIKYVRELRHDRSKLVDTMEDLQIERDVLNNSIKNHYLALPTNGTPQSFDHIRKLYDQYVRSRAQVNWKFWILGLILEPLLTSYNSTVSSGTLNEMTPRAFEWLDKTYSLIELRSAVSDKLKYLSITTNILSSEPSDLKDEVAKAINNEKGQHPNLYEL